jgi:hypothetical protein
MLNAVGGAVSSGAITSQTGSIIQRQLGVGAHHPVAVHKALTKAKHTSGSGIPDFAGGSTSPDVPSSSGGGGGSGASSKALTRSNALASILNYAGLTFTTDLEGTVKQIRTGITTMIDRLNGAVRDKYLASDKTLVSALRSSRTTLIALAQQEAAAAHGVANVQSILSTLRSDAASDRSALLSDFQGLGDLSQAPQTTSVAGLVQVDNQQARLARAYTRNLGILRKKGLSKTEYQSLLSAGPATDSQIVALLTKASSGQIRSIDSDEALFTHLGHAAGQASAAYVYGSRIKREDELFTAQKAAAVDLHKLLKDGLSDKGTHNALAAVEAKLEQIRRLLAQQAGAPAQARTKARTRSS